MNQKADSRPPILRRRSFLRVGAAGLAGAAALSGVRLGAQEGKLGKPTEFQIACMTLPYSGFSFERALAGIKRAGYRYVAWGIRHTESGQQAPLLPTDASPAKARVLGKRCRDLGLEPRGDLGIGRQRVRPLHGQGPRRG